jgi:hypothetical protein
MAWGAAQLLLEEFSRGTEAAVSLCQEDPSGSEQQFKVQQNKCSQEDAQLPTVLTFISPIMPVISQICDIMTN